MTFSPIATRSVATDKYSSRDGASPEILILHHTAGGGNDGNEELLSVGARRVSASYLLRNDGDGLVGIVPEEFQPWTTGGDNPDNHALTVEIVNTGGAPDWEVSATQLEILAQLAADRSRYYGWGPLHESNIRLHLEYMATACPGPFVTANRINIVNRANQILNGGVPATPAVTPDPAPAPPTRVVEGWDAPAFPFSGWHRYGDITGPNELHGGYHESERPNVKLIQQRLQYLGYADPNPGWADGLYERPTIDAVARWQMVNMAGVTDYPGEVWGDDWTKLFSADNVPNW